MVPYCMAAADLQLASNVQSKLLLARLCEAARLLPLRLRLYCCPVCLMRPGLCSAP